MWGGEPTLPTQLSIVSVQNRSTLNLKAQSLLGYNPANMRQVILHIIIINL